MKKIKIYTGDVEREKLFERGFHPKTQIQKVFDLLNSSPNNLSIWTNSPYIVEAFNTFGKEKNYSLEFYFKNKKVPPVIVFNEFSKPFQKLLFGNQSPTSQTKSLRDFPNGEHNTDFKEFQK